jgi:hypothetical protein
LVAVITALLVAGLGAALAMDSQRGGAVPRPFPLFPADNWWNQDIRQWPVDPNSASYIAFINNGGTRRLHPDFGGNAGTAQDPNAIYGMPYAVVSNVTDSDLKAVEFLYADESDGVDQSTGVSFPFYPIPQEAITEPYWVEGGDPAAVDRRSGQDRHLIIVDRDCNHLYELFNVTYNGAQGKWLAGSGAFFDMNTNHRRHDNWTSADAAGLAIFPGLIRYDEVYDPNSAEIRHAFRVTVRATDGFVYPASHRAGSTAGALPMGARLRLKASIDVNQRTNDPDVRKIFAAMQKYGLIVADNGSDLYITGTHDTRWNNGILNPAFANLTANDFEVIQLGYNPAPGESAVLTSITVSPAGIVGGQRATGTITLSGPAPTEGAIVSLSSANSAAAVPVTVTVPPDARTVSFDVSTSAVDVLIVGNITAAYAGITKNATLTVQPAPAVKLLSLKLSPATVSGGVLSVGTVSVSAPAPAGGVAIAVASSKPLKAGVPLTITIPEGTTSASFNVATVAVKTKTTVGISASYRDKTKKVTLTIRK